MKTLKLYLETSVWNFYFADDAPEKRDVTRLFFDQIQQGQYDVYVSEVVFREFSRASEEKQTKLLELVARYQPKELEVTEEVLRLARQYLDEVALPDRAVDDDQHAALASIYEMDALISWNLKHLANLKRMEKINGVNLKYGYSKKLEIITPMEVAYE
jgi:predicted nucleic acid-binding protein